jgi:hypothetical protein
MSQLTLRYEYDASFDDPKLTRDDFGRLSVSATTERFAARGGFWVQWQDVREFGEALAAFPITSDAPIVAEWGFDKLAGDDLILRIEIAPANARGDLVVRFEIADDYEPGERARASFLTNYPDVEAFRSDITKLMDRELHEAVLKGH